MDDTFKSVGMPFTQLWSIHAFLKLGDSVKQVPLVFVLMSSKAKANYTAVLSALLRHIDAPAVVIAEINFEVALWRNNIK